jgi:hypothetical protein
MKQVEFIWNDAFDKPKDIKKSILGLTENNKLIVFKDTIGRKVKHDESGHYTYVEYSNWDHLVYKYKIKYWTYQNNLIV